MQASQTYKTSSVHAPRLFTEHALETGADIILDHKQAHYLTHVMRLKMGDEAALFNGLDGEWRARISKISRKQIVLECIAQTRAQIIPGSIDYLFAPLKAARLDYLIQKACEMGASHLRPVITQYTNVRRINKARMRANAIEAAEQCGLLSIPEIAEPEPLDQVLAGWADKRALIFCDEAADHASPIDVLKGIEKKPLAVLIGPEGGFSDQERETLKGLNFVTAISLGPRIMRADTAGVAALALIQAVLGDWH